jgi:predicted DsbA family dithiol-disulfide isomerase
MTTDPVVVEAWVDPACPWAWQAAAWLRELRDVGHLEIAWRLFSLELNATPADMPFWEASQLYGAAHVSLVLAERGSGTAGFEALYVALGRRLHEEREAMTPETLGAAAGEAELEGLVDRALTDPSLAVEVTERYRQARQRDVFGVPTVSIGGSKPAYGPIMSKAPTGADATSWWEHVRWLVERPEFFELKRWPRDLRPGEAPPKGLTGS